MSAFDTSFDLISKALDVAALRHKVTANNLANVNTPGYRRLVVDFEQELSSALDEPGPVTMRVVQSDDPPGPDGNNVQFDREMADLQKAELIFAAAAQLADMRLKGLRAAIEGHS